MFRKRLAPTALALMLLATGMATSPMPAQAAQQMVDRVAAVVNEDVISYRDLKDRVAFTIKNLRTNPTAQQREDVEAAQMQDLIEEELLRQYAEERGYDVPESQVDSAIANMERASKQNAGSFKEFSGKYYETAREQVRMNVMREMIAERVLSPRIVVSDEEVNRMVDSIIARQDELDEKQLAQIFIPVSDDSKAGVARRTIERLHAQLRSGADFADLARTYSRDRSATEGGVIGWFRGGELIPAIDEAIKPLPKGGFTEPVQSSNGWHLFKVMDIREAPKPKMEATKEINITQLYAPVDTTSGTPAAVQNKKHMKEFKDIAEDIDSEEEFEEMVAEKIAESPLYFASGDMGWINIDTLDAALKTALSDADRGDIIGPVAGEKGVYLFYITDARETEPEALQNIRARVRRRLEARQTDLAFRSLLRDLRRRAFIEIRM